MARSTLFRALRRVLRKSPERAVGDGGVSRRQFFGSLGALAAVPALSACGDDGGGSGGGSVAVVGGGIAGLSAGYFLGLAGVKVDVYEASTRIGGRMYTDRTSLQGGQLCELGGELVDSNHLVVPAMCEAFGLTLDDLVEATPNLTQDIFHFGGSKLDEADIVAAFTPVADKMQMSITLADSGTTEGDTEYERVDALSIPEYLEQDCGLASTSMIRQLLELSYLEEYGLPVEQQSAWNLLYLIDAETPDPFRVFGDSDERYHIHQGNDALPTAVAGELGDRVKLEHKLTKVAKDGDTFVLTFAAPDGDVEVRAEHVVFALPFTKLREVDLSGSGLSDDKLEVINELGYGTNAKLMLQFSDRPWETAHQSAGGTISDVGQLQTTWATSRGQDGAQGILTNFVGGQRGLDMGSGTAESQAQMVLPWIDTIFPGTSATYIANSAVRQHWPTYEFNKGSYACYLVGQWRFFGTEGLRDGNAHFCGEHTSEDFQGYMEGGAETGTMTAAEVLDDLGVAHPAMLDSLVGVLTTGRVRAGYHGTKGQRMRLSQIRKRAYAQ